LFDFSMLFAEPPPPDTWHTDCDIPWQAAAMLPPQSQGGEAMNHNTRRPYCIRAAEEALEIPRLCIREFDCRRCPFDQWLDETAPTFAGPKRHKENAPERIAA
jgi:hypothetical protein